MIISREEKGSYSGGTYYICFKTLLPSSLSVKALERRSSNRIVTKENTLYSFSMPDKSNKYLVYEFSFKHEG